MRTMTISISLAALALAGCSTTPLPEDFSGKATYAIVKKVRCEAREAIQKKAIALMTHEKSSEFTRSEGFRLKNKQISFYKYDYKKLDKEIARYLEYYSGAGIAFDFGFDITEDNNNRSTVNLSGPIGIEKFTMGLVAGGKVTRQNARSLRTADAFGTLALEIDDAYCEPASDEKNFLYPIIGKVGIAERIDTFIDLNESGQLSIPKDPTVPAMVDTLKFTTVMTLNAKPKITINSPGSRIADAELNSENSRIDQHTIKIGLSLPPPKAPPTTTKAPAKSVAKSGKQNAADALDRQYMIDSLGVFTDIKKRLDAQ